MDFNDFSPNTVKEIENVMNCLSSGVVPTEVLYYRISALLMQELKENKHNYGTLSELKGMLEDFSHVLKMTILMQPTEISNALGITVIDVEEVTMIEESSFGR